MEYIRANYLFGEIISHTKLLNGTHLFSIKGLDKILSISEEDFGKCKVANTIEELCDEFVYRKIVCPKIECFEDCENKQEIYGAIWTDKGLIYVAKMNEKGELELL